jgi:hypothetical protein
MGIGLYDLILATNVATIEFLAFVQKTYRHIPFPPTAALLLGSALIGSSVFLIKAIQFPPLIIANVVLSFIMPFKGGFLLWLRQGVESLKFIHSIRNLQPGTRLTETQESLDIVRREYWAVGRLGLVGFVITLGMIWGLRGLGKVIEGWVRRAELKLERSILEVKGEAESEETKKNI